MIRKKKLNILILSLLICLLLLSACGGKELSSEFVQKEVEELAADVINMVNKEELEEIQELCNQEMKGAMTEDVLNEVFDMVKEFGEYDGIEKIDVAGVEDKASHEPIAVAVVKAKYANKSAVYTISFDTNMKLAGLYIK